MAAATDGSDSASRPKAAIGSSPAIEPGPVYTLTQRQSQEEIRGSLPSPRLALTRPYDEGYHHPAMGTSRPAAQKIITVLAVLALLPVQTRPRALPVSRPGAATRLSLARGQGGGERPSASGNRAELRSGPAWKGPRSPSFSMTNPLGIPDRARESRNGLDRGQRRFRRASLLPPPGLEAAGVRRPSGRGVGREHEHGRSHEPAGAHEIFEGSHLAFILHEMFHAFQAIKRRSGSRRP